MMLTDLPPSVDQTALPGAGSERMNSDAAILEALRDLSRPLHLHHQGGKLELAPDHSPFIPGRSILVPPCRAEDLGDITFRKDHGLRYAYVTGSMANGIASADIVESMGQAGMLGFFGSAGLPLPRIEAVIDRIQKALGPNGVYGVNLINSPHEPGHENATVDLFLRKGVRLIEASAFLDLSLPVVRYRLQGIHKDASGKIVTPNKVVVKVSRVEVGSKFFAPPPERYLQDLVRQNHLTPEQAHLAAQVPVAQDLTAEADSGGHTDNRPLVTLLPTMLALRDRAQAQFGFEQKLRVGAAGGIATPASVAGALAMGAAYVVTGSINQACRESGSSDQVRELLAQAEQADTAMAPAADMFEMGVKVQVLKRGTMFAMRASKLYDIYRSAPSLEEIPAAERTALEKNLFKAPLQEIWAQTESYFQQRDPSQVQRALQEPKHKMALVFRWYLGQSSRWANAGEAGRKVDYQIWCGPAMGAFNEWTRGSFLEKPAGRHVVPVAQNLMIGAALLLRLQALRSQGVAVKPAWEQVRPMEAEEITRRLGI